MTTKRISTTFIGFNGKFWLLQIHKKHEIYLPKQFLSMEYSIEYGTDSISVKIAKFTFGYHDKQVITIYDII